MAWNPERKVQSRQKIVESAAHLFAQKGFDAISIDDVMCHAGLTRGAFYSHFSSKTQLYSQAILVGANMARRMFDSRQGMNIMDFASAYLQIGREKNDERFCPLAFLVTDIGHRQTQIKSSYAKVLKGFQSVLIGLGLSDEQSVQASILLIGGLALSRTVNDDEAKLVILNGALEGVKALFVSTQHDMA